MTKQTIEQIAQIKSKILEKSKNPISTLFGDDFGTAKKIRDGQTFRIFVKGIEASASGKAQLVELTVFMTDETLTKSVKPYTYIRGATYLPNFVVEKKDVYWIVENKIWNTSFRNELSIDSSYVPIGHKIYNPVSFSNITPEERANDHVKDMIAMITRLEIESFPLVLAQ